MLFRSLSCLHDNFCKFQPNFLKLSIHNQGPIETNPIVCEGCDTMATLDSQLIFFNLSSDIVLNFFFLNLRTKLCIQMFGF